MNKIKNTLWICIAINIVFCFVEFLNVITPLYILALILLIFFNSTDNKLYSKLATIFVSILGIILTIFGLGTLAMIISGIILITYYISDSITIKNQKKYDEKYKSNSEEDFSGIHVPYIEGYDLNKIKNEFNKYVGNFDKTNYIINLKKYHTFCVADNSYSIAKFLKLDNEGKFLSYLIGILHDIGRFQQVKEYIKLEDTCPMDHGDYAYDVLKKGILRNFILDKSHDDIILKAVKNHNKLCIEDVNNEQEKMYCQIVRDADKLDILKRLSEGTYIHDYEVTEDMSICDEIKEAFKKHNVIDFKLVKNKADEVVLRIALVFDLSYEYSLKQVIKNNYIAKYLKLLRLNDDTRKYINECIDEIYVFIEERI